jgi:hypothetical protein
MVTLATQGGAQNGCYGRRGWQSHLTDLKHRVGDRQLTRNAVSRGTGRSL